MNTEKTEVLHLAREGDDTGTIFVGTTRLKDVSDFRYLGSHLSEDCSLDKEVTYRIGRAAAAFSSLRERFFNNRNLKLSTRVSVCNADCLSTLLYGSETWTHYRHQIMKLEMYHMSCLQRILSVTRQEKLTHNEILSRTMSNSIELLAAQRQLSWVDHVICMEDNRLPKYVLYGDLLRGQRQQGGQRKRFKDYKMNPLKMPHCSPRPRSSHIESSREETVLPA